MKLGCMFGAHQWDGCKCSRCGKTRDQDHDWEADCEHCSKCGVNRKNAHDWTNNCEKCARCGCGNWQIPEGPSIALGMSERDVTQAIGNPDERDTFRNKTVLCYLRFGFLIILYDDMVSSVFICGGADYPGKTGGYKPFVGILPGNLTSCCHRSDAARLFGSPDKVDVYEKHPVYFHTYDKLGLVFGFLDVTHQFANVTLSDPKDLALAFRMSGYNPSAISLLPSAKSGHLASPHKWDGCTCSRCGISKQPSPEIEMQQLMDAQYETKAKLLYRNRIAEARRRGAFSEAARLETEMRRLFPNE